MKGLTLLAALVSIGALSGCNGGAAAAPAGGSTTTDPAAVTAKGKQAGGVPMGINPNYKGSAASDDARVGSATKK